MATGLHRVSADLVRVQDANDRLITTLAWGDTVEVLDKDSSTAKVRIPSFKQVGDTLDPELRTGMIRKPTSQVLVEDAAFVPRVLKVDFVDVQQGDGAVIETPGAKVMLVDGGETKLFARYLAARFPATTAAAPREVDCVLVTHGDADHFAGLTEINRSEAHPRPSKRAFIQPRRVFHNGLVKRPSKVPELESFGTTKKQGTTPVITELHDDLVPLDPATMNKPFQAWRAALEAWGQRAPIDIRHLQQGDDAAFDFLSAEGITVEVLGPVPTPVGSTSGLAFLRTPPDHLVESAKPGAFSASHTINGHSVVLRLTYGGFSFLLAGDLNEPAEAVLVAAHDAGTLSLRSEVLKVPHHGSADYSAEFLRRVQAAVSVISSGDENERVEFVHPRATLLGALGRFARPELDEPLIFITELAAFFKTIGPADVVGTKPPKQIFAFERAAFGIVRTRTDGQRLLVYTDTGKRDQKEAYAFVFDQSGGLRADPVRIA